MIAAAAVGKQSPATRAAFPSVVGKWYSAGEIKDAPRPQVHRELPMLFTKRTR